jgi:hypothetical protein
LVTLKERKTMTRVLALCSLSNNNQCPINNSNQIAKKFLLSSSRPCLEVPRTYLQPLLRRSGPPKSPHLSTLKGWPRLPWKDSHHKRLIEKEMKNKGLRRSLDAENARAEAKWSS